MEFQDEQNVTIQYNWCTEWDLDNESDVIKDFLDYELKSGHSIVRWDKECLVATSEGTYYIEANMEDDNGYDHQVLIRKKYYDRL